MTQGNNFLEKYKGLNFTDLHVAFDDLRTDLYSKREVNLKELEAIKHLMDEWKRIEKAIQDTNIMIATDKDIDLIMTKIREIFTISRLKNSIFLSFTPDDSID